MATAQHPAITEWYQTERQQRALQRDDAGFVMGFPLWGKQYVNCFFDYMLPSLLAPANLSALEARRWELVVYVDEPTTKLFLTDWFFQDKIPIYVRLIPDNVMQVVHENPGYKYALLTAVHNLLMQQAAAKNAAFSMGTADVVYSDRFFERLLVLGPQHDVIANLALITSEAGAGPALASCRENGVLTLSASELGSHGWRHASGALRSWLLNDIETFETLPASHIAVWRGLDAIYMHCPHLTPIWLSAERCRAMSTDLGDTLDALGHLYMGADFYVPTVADEMTILTLDDTRNHPVAHVSIEKYREGFRPFMSCMQQFRAHCVIPTLPTLDGLPEDVIEQRFQKLMQMLGM